jgi:Ca-activated chloride channel family protein
MAVAVAVVLGGVAVLLAGAAQAAERSALAPTPAAIKVRRGDELAYSGEIPLLDTEVHIRVTGPIARARVKQMFRNPGKEWLEGVYVFPLPDDAAVDRLKLRIGERVIEGEIRERSQAKAEYEQARRTGQRASLVEQERPNMFTTSVANIGPEETVTVEMEYQQVVRIDQGRFSLRFPMVVGPRYIPQESEGAPRVEDAARISPPVAKPGAEPTALNPVRIDIDLDAGAPLARLDSAFHPICTEEQGNGRYRVRLAAESVPANRDFELAWEPQVQALAQPALFTETKGEYSYAMLMLLPPQARAAAERLPREVIYVIDTSGSMHGASIQQAKEALQLAVARLQPGDRFNIIEFNSYARSLFEDVRSAEPATLKQAQRFVDSLQATGGTEMARALRLALDAREHPDRVRQVVFLTDGSVGNEDELFRLIRERLGDSRLFTVGIGSAPNSHFMTQAALTGRGTFTYIGKLEEVKEKMGGLFAKLEAPVLKDIEIDWPQAAQAETWPKRIPDLYLGEPLVVTARLRAAGGTVRVRATRSSEPWQAQVNLGTAHQGEGIGVLWGRDKIAALLQTMREGTAEDEVRPQVITVALEHRLASKYTSLVAVDKTPARPADKSLTRTDLPLNLPEGWSYQHVFGELPRGAAGWRWNLMLGLLASMLSALLALVFLRSGGTREHVRG